MDIQKIPLAEFAPEHWIPVSQALQVGGVTGAIISHCEIAAVSGTELVLRLDGAHDTLYNDTHRQRIQTALGKYFGTGISLQVEPGTIQSETPAAWRERRRLERLAAAKESFVNDDRVQAIVTAFSGRIQEHTIEPVG